jgi:hypothetical protein
MFLTVLFVVGGIALWLYMGEETAHSMEFRSNSWEWRAVVFLGPIVGILQNIAMYAILGLVVLTLMKEDIKTRISTSEK